MTRRQERSPRNGEPKRPPIVRCAVYTRKSTDEGLDREFNSLDAQREAGEAFVTSMHGEGWMCLPDRYDDGGFSGGNMDRPALQRLLADIQAGKVDCVVVYKVDRLSRSLLDFARIMETLDNAGISFISVTQHFNTANSMGRLMLHILLSFAQFERELISERTRDKMGAARRKGKWAGGRPLLGYDIVNSKLVVNEPEAGRVQEIFRLYLERKSTLDVARDLNARGWTSKRWTTKKGTVRGGFPFNKGNLGYLLRNVAYVGQVCYQGELYAGEHAGIVDPEMFAQVQQLLLRNGSSGGAGSRGKKAGLLSGLLRCHACRCAMTHSQTAKRGRRYRYYVCTKAQKRGYDVCPAPSVSAPEIERFVVDQIRAVGRDPAILAATVGEVAQQSAKEAGTLRQETEAVSAQIRDAYAELSRVSIERGGEARIASLQREIDASQRRLVEIRSQLDGLSRGQIEPEEIERALAQFEPLWDALTSREQGDILDLLIERVDFDGVSGELTLAFHPAGIRSILEQNRKDEA